MVDLAAQVSDYDAVKNMIRKAYLKNKIAKNHTRNVQKRYNDKYRAILQIIQFIALRKPEDVECRISYEGCGEELLLIHFYLKKENEEFRSTSFHLPIRYEKTIKEIIGGETE